MTSRPRSHRRPAETATRLTVRGLGGRGSRRAAMISSAHSPVRLSGSFALPVARLPRSPVSPRRGYTLIELMVVITIISILISIVAFASVGFIGQARSAATRSTIKKVDEAIQERVGAVNRWHMQPANRLQNDVRNRLSAGAWQDYPLVGQYDADLAESRKRMLRDLLPVHQPVRPAVGNSSKDVAVSYGDLVNALWFRGKFNLDADPQLNSFELNFMYDRLTDWDSRNDDGTVNSTGVANNTEAGQPQGLDRPGEVFFYALLNAPVFGGQRVAEEDFTSSELIDPDGDGFMELADAWGEPLRFYRWPTRLVSDANGRQALMPNAPSSDLSQDPDDRGGYLRQPNPSLGVQSVVYFHDADVWHTPMVVSAGPDLQLGLEEPEQLYPAAMPALGVTIPRYGLAAPTNAEALYDNITNHNSDGGL